MKKLLIPVCTPVFVSLLLLFLLLTTPALAADLSIYIDNRQIPSAPYSTGEYDENGEEIPGIYMDVPPQILEGRVFVPLRIIATYLDAEIDWQHPHVNLNYGDTSLQLTIDSKTALINGGKIELETAPYILEGRTMVPLRFISEAFGFEARYLGDKVTIITPTLYIDGRKVVAVQSYARMTMGGWRNETKTNICINKIYYYLQNNMNEEIDAPEYFGDTLNLDTYNYYYMGNEISFMESEGLEGAIIQQYETYMRIINHPTQTPSNPNLGEWLIFDVTHEKWYKVYNDNFQEEFSAYGTGVWLEILNNVV